MGPGPRQHRTRGARIPRAGDSGLAIHIRVPTSSREAVIALEHARSLRAGLPHQGQATVELRAGSRVVGVLPVPSSTPHVDAVHFPSEEVTANGELVVTISLIDATTTYRLHRVQIVFY